MAATQHGRIRRLRATLCGVAALAGVAAGCAGFRVERDGRKTGDAICDIREASSADEAQNAIADAQRWIDRAARTTGRPVDEDVRDINENLSDLVKHVSNGNATLAQQDVAVIRRNVESIERVTRSRAQRYYQGLDQGLSNCAD